MTCVWENKEKREKEKKRKRGRETTEIRKNGMMKQIEKKEKEIAESRKTEQSREQFVGRSPISFLLYGAFASRSSYLRIGRVEQRLRRW